MISLNRHRSLALVSSLKPAIRHIAAVFNKVGSLGFTTSINIVLRVYINSNKKSNDALRDAYERVYSPGRNAHSLATDFKITRSYYVPTYGNVELGTVPLVDCKERSPLKERLFSDSCPFD